METEGDISNHLLRAPLILWCIMGQISAKKCPLLGILLVWETYLKVLWCKYGSIIHFEKGYLNNLYFILEMLMREIHHFLNKLSSLIRMSKTE